MARWRYVKNGKNKNTINQNNNNNIYELNASVTIQIKAVITDIFMLIMPLMYISIYLLLDGRKGFSENMTLGWGYILIPYLIISIIFLIKKGQTPGLKAYEIKLVNTKDHKNINIIQAIIRQFFSILNTMSIIGLFLPFFRKDKRTVQDIIASTTIIKFPNI